MVALAQSASASHTLSDCGGSLEALSDGRREGVEVPFTARSRLTTERRLTAMRINPSLRGCSGFVSAF